MVNFLLCFVVGDECGEDKGHVITIFCSLYSLKSAGFSWISPLAAVLREIGLNPTMLDPKVWIRAVMRPDGYEYYEMLLVYVDHITIVSNLGDEVAIKIDNFHKIKEGSQGTPTWYLGADTENIQTDDGHEIWTTSSRS